MGRWLTPETLAPNTSHVRRLVIPGDAQMLANISGALLELTFPNAWEEYGAVTPDEAAQAALDMYTRYLVETWSMIGAIVPAITASTPDGCLELDGSTYSGDEFPDLYAVIHDAWKDGEGNFTVPDLRGRFPLAMNGTYDMGDTGGAATVTLTTDQIPSHSHSTGNSFTGAAVMPGEGPVLIPNPIPASTGYTGGGLSHENLPPYMALRFVLIAW